MSDEKLKIILQHLESVANYLEDRNECFDESNYATEEFVEERLEIFRNSESYHSYEKIKRKQAHKRRRFIRKQQEEELKKKREKDEQNNYTQDVQEERTRSEKANLRQLRREGRLKQQQQLEEEEEQEKMIAGLTEEELLRWQPMEAVQIVQEKDDESQGGQQVSQCDDNNMTTYDVTCIKDDENGNQDEDYEIDESKLVQPEVTRVEEVAVIDNDVVMQDVHHNYAQYYPEADEEEEGEDEEDDDDDDVDFKHHHHHKQYRQQYRVLQDPISQSHQDHPQLKIRIKTSRVAS